jgi:hypothetical protein
LKWQSEAMNKLRDYDARKTALVNIPEKLQALNEQFTGIKSARTDAEPVSGGTNHREDMLLDNIVKREELKRNYHISKAAVAVTERGLNELDDEQRRILELFYIRRPKDYISRLCDELHVEQATLYRKKDEALRKFTIAVYGIVEL